MANQNSVLAVQNANSAWGRQLVDGDPQGGHLPLDQMVAIFTQNGGQGGLQGMVNDMNEVGKPMHMTAQDYGVPWDTLMPGLAAYYQANPNQMPDTTPNTQNLADVVTNNTASGFLDANGNFTADKATWDAAQEAAIKKNNLGAGDRSFGGLAKSFLTEGALPFIAKGAAGIYGVGTGLESLLGAADVGGGVDMFGNNLGKSYFNGGTISPSDGLGDATWGANPRNGQSLIDEGILRPDWQANDALHNVTIDGNPASNVYGQYQGANPTGTGYEGLGYTPQEIAQLQAGTYAGAEQTAAQSASQLGGLNSLTQQGGMLQKLADMGVPTNVLQTLGNTSGSSSALSRVFNGTATASDYASLAGKAGSSILGYLGAENKANALTSVADKNLALGAPYRGMLAASYDPSFSMSNEPGYKDAIDQSMNSYLRKASTGGNPFSNPGVSTEALKYVTAGTALPAMNTYRSQLGTFGQLGLNTAGTAQIGAAGASGGTYDALGYGLGQLTQPDSTLQELLKKYASGSSPSLNFAGIS